MLVCPKLVYHTECNPPDHRTQELFEHWQKDFILGLGDLPRFTVGKTLHSEPRCGLGLHHCTVRHGQRVLDMVDRTLRCTTSPTTGQPPAPLLHHLLDVKCQAARYHGATMDPSLPVLPPAQAHPLAGCVITEQPQGPPLEAT